jgi:hypothetical protein
VWNASGVEVPLYRVGRRGTEAMKAGNGRRGGGSMAELIGSSRRVKVRLEEGEVVVG